MKRLLTAMGVVAALLLVAPSSFATAAEAPGKPAVAPATAPASTSAKCEYKWRRKKVIKRVRRNGKIRKIVKYRWRRVCVPVKEPAPARIGVKAFEFGFILSTVNLTAGDTIAELNNQGEDPHDLHIQKVGGGTETVFPETLPSSYSRVRFDTEPGTYRFWCALPFHAERGMDATVTVR